MNALAFTTPQLVLLYGWCEVAEESTSVEANAAATGRQWELSASLFERLNDCRAILLVLATELHARDERPPARPRPPKPN